MAATALVALPYEAGWNLLTELLNQHYPITALFWAAVDENDWRLFLATDRVGTDGPLHVYDVVQQALSQLPEDQAADLRLNDVSVVQPQAHIVQEMHQKYGSVPPDRRVVRRISILPGEAYVYYMA